MSLTKSFLKISELKALGAQYRKNHPDIEPLIKKYEDGRDAMVHTDAETTYDISKMSDDEKQSLKILKYAGITKEGILYLLNSNDLRQFAKRYLRAVKQEHAKDPELIRQIAFTIFPLLKKEHFSDDELSIIQENHPDHCDHTDESCGCNHKNKDEATEDDELNYWTGFEE